MMLVQQFFSIYLFARLKECYIFYAVKKLVTTYHKVMV